MAWTAAAPRAQGVSHRKYPYRGAATEGVNPSSKDATGLPRRQQRPEVQFPLYPLSISHHTECDRVLRTHSEPVAYRGST